MGVGGVPALVRDMVVPDRNRAGEREQSSAGFAPYFSDEDRFRADLLLRRAVAGGGCCLMAASPVS
ncbi:hypothetical protein GCM10010989_19470 [Croceicoccus pelagius]|uniref:Uncharacterized protein n=1 Tax=Croceicoccus pelagius TaxID=1703341 RepID=A0A917DJP8_9SPHN|nr:hypothetical protein GCM10010989_19470 [Croceicoccus pelagius]